MSQPVEPMHKRVRTDKALRSMLRQIVSNNGGYKKAAPLIGVSETTLRRWLKSPKP